ncbi:MAG: hypothetical protein IPM76_20575 [Chloroflexi bacterium]|nr:hypothetical protein [Chloroflexota bacterium]
MREKIESEQAGTRLALREAENRRGELADRLAEIEEERRQILLEARAQAKAEIEAVQAELSRARRQIRDAVSLNQLKTVSKEVAAVEEAELKPITAVTAPPKPSTKQIRRKLQVGDTVLVKSLDRKGEVVSLSNNEALVAMGRLQMRARFEDLEFKGRPVEEELEIAGYSICRFRRQQFRAGFTW